jgi:YaiO family outer membrane protein
MKYLLLLFIATSISVVFAQEHLTVDELFVKARNAAFELKDRKQARALCLEILKRSPGYTDVSVFLARLYTWDDMYDSARIVFSGIFAKDSSNYDAISAAIDLEYWTDNYQQALVYCNLGLEKFPKSEEFLLKKAKVLSQLKDYDGAFSAIETLLSINNSNSDALDFAETLKEEVRINSITVNYEYDKFNEIFDPWQLASIAYSRRTPIGTAILRLNYANRFDTYGQQIEMDMYPKFADGLYAYMNFGYSNISIFPRTKYGFSLYYSLPLSLEVDAGFRLLKYSSDTWIYTAALGKYYSNFWFSLRTYITPSVQTASHSYSLTIRYYFSGADDYFAVSGGSGISPEATSVDNNYNWLKSNSGSIEYQSKVSKTLILDLTYEYSNEQQTYGAFIGDYSGSIGLKFLF